MRQEYYGIFLFIGLATLLGIIIITASYILAEKGSVEMEKISAYECGFNPFEDARESFNVKFYLIGILFLIFDLEISFLFPWAIWINPIYGGNTEIIYWPVILFLIILTIGFVYEWKKGALET